MLFDIDALSEPFACCIADSVERRPAGPLDGVEQKLEGTISREESEKAVAITLRGGPASPEAHAWVACILDTVILPAGAVSDRPSSRRKALIASGALMGDLFALQRGRKRGGPPVCGSHGMSPRDFPAKELGFGLDIFQPVTTVLEGTGFLVVARGLPRWQTWQGPDGRDVITTKGRVTRFRLTAAALKSAETFGVALADWDRHWGRATTVTVQVRADRAALGPTRPQGTSGPQEATGTRAASRS